MKQSQECLICGSSTEMGFVLDRGTGAEMRSVEEWWAGKPERSFWAGVKKPERTFTVSTLRCTRCGFLMEFANSDEAGI